MDSAQRYPEGFPVSLGEQLALGHTLVALWDSRRAEPWRVPPGGDLLQHLMVYANTAQTIELSRAALLLYEKGHALGAIPIVRSALEFAMTAAWLTLDSKHANAVVWQGQKTRRSVLDEIQRHGIVDVSDALQEAIAELDNLPEVRDGAAAKFQERCARMEGGASIYAHYRVLSQYSHPGSFAADIWVEAAAPDSTEAAPVRLRLEPRLDTAARAIITLLSMLVVAQVATERLVGDPRREAELRRHAETLGITYGFNPRAAPTSS